MGYGVRSILVLDGDPASKGVVKRVLSDEGYWVFATDDPKMALRMARVEAVDLVLTDLSMAVLDVVPRWERRRTDPADVQLSPPVAEGYAVLRALQLGPATARYPVVSFREDGTEEGNGPRRFSVVDYVAKPVNADGLRRKVEYVLEGLERPAVLDDPSSEGDTNIPAPAFETLPSGLRTALVVDPRPDFREWICRLLRPYGFTIHEASDCEEAIRIALAQRPWLILTEVKLGRMDGFDFCRRVRSLSLLSHTPLVFLSDWDDYFERSRGLAAGADDYLSKRTPIREILIRLQLVLKRYTDLGFRARRGAAMEGRIELFGAPGVLQTWHMSRLSGVFTARCRDRATEMRFRDGEIVSARTGVLSGAHAVYDFLSWTQGRFEFVPGVPGTDRSLGNFELLLLEACRLLDEERRNRVPEQNPPSGEVIP